MKAKGTPCQDMRSRISFLYNIFEPSSGQKLTETQSSFIAPIFYILSTTFVKLVALSLYLRMNHEKLRIISLIVMGYVCLQAVAFGIAAIFQCVPVQAAWDMTIKDRQCYAIDNYFICQTALNFATDLIVYVLPLPVISRLHVPMKKKVVLGFFMGLGLLYVTIRFSFL